MSQRNAILSGLSWNTVTVVLQVLIQLVYTAIMARWIAPADFALMGVVLSLMGFAEIFSQVGIGPAIIQRKEVEQRHVNGAFWTAVVLGISFTLLFVLMAPWIGELYQMPNLVSITQVVSTAFIISAFGVVPRSFMMKNLSFRSFFKASMWSVVVGNLVVGLTLAYMGFGVWAYVWALFSQNVIMTLGYWLLEPIQVGWKGTRQGIHELLRYGTGSTLFNSLNYAATKVDVSLVPLVLPAGQLTYAGWYERSAYVVSLPITIMAKLSDNVLFSGMSKMQDEKERLQKLVLLTTNVLAIAIIPTAVWVILHAEWLMTFYLGNQYQGSGVILQFLFFAVIFRTLNRVSDALLRAVDATFSASWIKAIYVMMMFVACWVGAIWGMKCIAMGIALSTAIHFMMGAWKGQQLIEGSFGQLLAITWNGWRLGIIVLLDTLLVKWFLFDGESSLMEIIITLLMMLGTYVVVLYKVPHWLGEGSMNPIAFIPERIRTRFRL
ncbi:MAG: polysaccharide export protein [Bacteroidota bacterium]|jgi:PST family polysaccharide transporter